MYLVLICKGNLFFIGDIQSSSKRVHFRFSHPEAEEGFHPFFFLFGETVAVLSVFYIISLPRTALYRYGVIERSGCDNPNSPASSQYPENSNPVLENSISVKTSAEYIFSFPRRFFPL
jgi:hypothetical protein